MGHYSCMVLIPPDGLPDPRGETWTKNQNDEASRRVHELMQKYDVNSVTEPREKSCPCLHLLAIIQAKRVAEKVLPLASVAEQYRQRVSLLYPETAAKLNKSNWRITEDLTEDEDYEISQIWKTCVKERVELEQEIADAHVLAGKSDPNCNICNGTGTYNVNYNPDAHWEGWNIGGVSEDQTANVNVQANAKTGAQAGNDTRDNDFPYAIITPDGNWYEREDNEAPVGWRTRGRSLLDQHKECIAVRVTCRV